MFRKVKRDEEGDCDLLHRVFSERIFLLRLVNLIDDSLLLLLGVVVALFGFLGLALLLSSHFYSNVTVTTTTTVKLMKLI